MLVKEKLEKATIGQLAENDWVVMGHKIGGGAINMGNYSTSAEAKALVDFINAGIKSDLKIEKIQWLNDSIHSLLTK